MKLIYISVADMQEKQLLEGLKSGVDSRIRFALGCGQVQPESQRAFSGGRDDDVGRPAGTKWGWLAPF